MRRQGWMILLLAASLLLPGLGPQIPSAVTLPAPVLSDDLQIRQLLDAYIDAENRMDPLAIQRLWPSMPAELLFVSNPDGFSSPYRSHAAKLLQIQDLQIEATTAAAQVSLQSDVELRAGGKQRLKFSGLFAFVRKDGEWRILSIRLARL